jgi:pyroglutamyl-peptidase
VFRHVLLIGFEPFGPHRVTNSAGTYLCNQWLYEALALTADAAPPVPTGFLHVPALPAQANELGRSARPR